MDKIELLAFNTWNGPLTLAEAETDGSLYELGEYDFDLSSRTRIEDDMGLAAIVARMLVGDPQCLRFVLKYKDDKQEFSNVDDALGAIGLRKFLGEVHTLHIEMENGEVRQYSFHLGTDRRVALAEGWQRAKTRLANNAKSVALKQGDKIIRIWDWQDMEQGQ